MRVLTLDLSLSTGYAVFDVIENHGPELVAWGRLSSDQRVNDYGLYPYNYVKAAEDIARLSAIEVDAYKPDVVVIEETNGSKSRYTQKILEFIHFAILKELEEGPKLAYINTGDWRRSLGIVMGKEDKKLNSKLSAAKRKARDKGTKLDKKALGIRGKINKKHLALRFVNEKYPSLNLKVKDDDVADAICLGLAYIKGVPLCDGNK